MSCFEGTTTATLRKLIASITRIDSPKLRLITLPSTSRRSLHHSFPLQIRPSRTRPDVSQSAKNRRVNEYDNQHLPFDYNLSSSLVPYQLHNSSSWTGKSSKIQADGETLPPARHNDVEPEIAILDLNDYPGQRVLKRIASAGHDAEVHSSHDHMESVPAVSTSSERTQSSPAKGHLKAQRFGDHGRETWQIQKQALTKKFGSLGWNPRKRLSPDAIEGLRALHAQFPEKYTTPELAQQFAVSPEAIRRILKSKWRPKEEEELDRRKRWEKRGEAIWSRMAEIGIKPPKKWRQMGVGKDQVPLHKRRGRSVSGEGRAWEELEDQLTRSRAIPEASVAIDACPTRLNLPLYERIR